MTALTVAMVALTGLVGAQVPTLDALQRGKQVVGRECGADLGNRIYEIRLVDVPDRSAAIERRAP